MSDSGFVVTAVHVDGEVVLMLQGELDALSAPDLAAEAVKWSGSSEPLVFDCAGITFMDSSGLGVAAAVLQRMQEGGGTLVMRNASQQVRRIFTVTGLDSYVTFDERACRSERLRG